MPSPTHCLVNKAVKTCGCRRAAAINSSAASRSASSTPLATHARSLSSAAKAGRLASNHAPCSSPAMGLGGDGVGVGPAVGVGRGVGAEVAVGRGAGVNAGTGVFVSGTSVAVGTSVFVGGTGVAVATGVNVGVGGTTVPVGNGPAVGTATGRALIVSLVRAGVGADSGAVQPVNASARVSALTKIKMPIVLRSFIIIRNSCETIAPQSWHNCHRCRRRSDDNG